MKFILFICGFVIFAVLAGLIAWIALWLLTLVVSVITFNWTFVLVISGIAGICGGILFLSD